MVNREAPAPPRPKLVFFRWARESLPDFVKLHLNEHVRCLAETFDVTVVSEDCDYDEVCDRYQPDLTLFESGVYAGPRKIINTSAHPAVPKLGLCNSDAYCVTRSVFLADMANWGVETYFTISVSMAEYFPEIADRLFVWPNFADTEVYRDYGQPKVVPVLLTGSQAVHYPWRNAIGALLASRFPAMSTPHAGWFDSKAAAGMVYGEPYARLLNLAQVAPTCGTVAKEVVRKHLEIPAAATCLITERTASLEAAGFVDQQNCIFAEESDVVERVAHLLGDPDELARITRAGYELVRSRHAIRNRDQLLQWYQLNRDRKPTERIVQPGPFQSLRTEDAAASTGNGYVISQGRDRQVLIAADDALRSGQWQRAESLYLQCLNYHFMPEPLLGLARTRLQVGDAAAALEWINRPIHRAAHDHQAQEPDPVEWAYLIRALLCAGQVAGAVERAARFPALSHPELDRIRAVMTGLTGRSPTGSTSPSTSRTTSPDGLPEQVLRRPSVHALDEQTDQEWNHELATMLTSCGQAKLSQRVVTWALPPARTRTRADLSASAREWLARSTLGRLIHRARYELRRAREPRVPQNLQVLARLTTNSEISSAVFVGVHPGDRVAMAVLAGLRHNPSNPAMVWLGDPMPTDRSVESLQYGGGGTGQATSRRATSGRAADPLPGLSAGAAALIMVGSRTPSPVPLDQLEQARWVILVDLAHPGPLELHLSLTENPRWQLIIHDPDHPAGGFSAFARQPQEKLTSTR
jgi:hypothetical protein